MPNIDLSILNQRQTPAFYADVLANRPAAGFIGRIFVSTNTFEFYRDNGTGWDLIGGPGAGTITGSGAAGQITYWNGASTVTGDNGLFYDAVNDRLGIGTITPGAAIDAHSTQSTILQLNQTAINDTRIAFQLSGSALWRLGNFYNGGANDFELFDVIGAQAPLTVKKTTGQVLIGTTTVGSGKLVVASAFGDNGIQVVGATSPSLRIDNAATGPTKRVGLGIATNTNNFIQGSADRDFCIFNGSTAAASPILFGVYDAGLTNVQEAARISAARNFLVGTSVDAGFKLQVSGTGYISNSVLIGTTSNLSNRTLVVSGNAEIGASNRLFFILNNPSHFIGYSSASSGDGVVINGAVTVDLATNGTIGLRNRNGNILIGTTTDAGFKLDVNGSARVGAGLTLSSSSSQIGTSGGGNSATVFYGNTGAGWNGFAFGNVGGTNYNFEIRTNQNFSIAYGALYATTATNAGNGTPTSPNASAVLQADSVSKGFLPPRMNTTEKNAIGTPATGLVVFDTTLGKLCVFSTTWQTITSV